MSFKDVFKTDLIDVNITVNDEIELFNYASKKLLEKSLVKTGYAAALAKREEEFPTGLMTKNFNIAIPHANPENINSPFIYILRLTKPITVKQMADKEKIKVKDVFILGIKDGQKQVNVLAALMNLFVNDAFAKDFLAATTSKEIYSSVIQHLEDD
ncbi:PTS sugar transporter subunit IIA [Lactobacillus sp. M0398]|uniref:PTS sugar transporter subunit IIA n=1 Tax=unclassified Lactobacillus TaxID=2620435 RepID=UPI0018DC27C0|nr:MULTISPECIES: PTS sugar transporter subunit IIA [unclassified Lactobacillus]MBI0120970.1 PTS sugar transporter subunit IIA [Lactobacillus sp. M0398]MBI0123117.1 PTS sugar transporter subunit IIA [Lactobacillus sp. W8174]MBI0135285.1 PTS sugar transporter subunit IIA [Lactobacillus sp. W8173]